MVRPAGFEPASPQLAAGCSFLLSYGRSIGAVGDRDRIRTGMSCFATTVPNHSSHPAINGA